MKYIITVPNRINPENRPLLSIQVATLADARRIWKGSKGKRIWKNIKNIKK